MYNIIYYNNKRNLITYNVCQQFEEPRLKYTSEAFDEDAIKKWVFVNSMPYIVEFSHDTASKIFGGQIKYHLLLFLSKVSLKTNFLSS